MSALVNMLRRAAGHVLLKFFLWMMPGLSWWEGRDLNITHYHYKGTHDVMLHFTEPDTKHRAHLRAVGTANEVALMIDAFEKNVLGKGRDK